MEAAEIDRIVRQSRSNLAMTLICLPREARRDMQLFYAFCRVVDDIADEPGRTIEQKYLELTRWSEVLAGNVTAELAPMERAVIDLMQRRSIPVAEMEGILQGMRQDVEPQQFETWGALREYCYGVASCVGLVSIRLFGCQQPASRTYAESLGYALQLTNILRDVGQDLRENDRIYLPQEDLRRFGVTVASLRAGNRSPEFLQLMAFETARARDYYAEALRHLTKSDKPRLRAAETMRRVYTRVLDQMEADQWQVFSKRYRVSKFGKLYFLARAVVGTWFGR
jgi:15-cis-phytoene synthase